ncbi:hypothetical protein N44_04768 [Microcystis aeruginosa NIES-44]|uniref:Uncharacterized protein n=1 Tax=Microcystis aeruginosa NIES-44 TaxID=449439 RepID=A0A0A1W1I8_MICAE|nr:hypothetical protein N44_04768 [Microcystis aeruginosa NIES-44]
MWGSGEWGEQSCLLPIAYCLLPAASFLPPPVSHLLNGH